MKESIPPLLLGLIIMAVAVGMTGLSFLSEKGDETAAAEPEYFDTYGGRDFYISEQQSGDFYFEDAGTSRNAAGSQWDKWTSGKSFLIVSYAGESCEVPYSSISKEIGGSENTDDAASRYVAYVRRVRTDSVFHPCNGRQKCTGKQLE
ncbi:MAG: hypothetical protein ACOYJO_07270 [Eubacterium sp.]|jgi:hypothetical protein